MTPEQKQRNAHQIVTKAIKNGTLTRKPCEATSLTGKGECLIQPVVAHHDNYDEPLSIRWLCPIHHAERHKELGWGTTNKAWRKDSLR